MKWTLALLLALCVGAVSCGEKPEARPRPDGGAGKVTGETPPAGEKDANPPDGGKPADVGVEDFVDYAIGKKQLEIKKRVETKVKAIESEYNRKLEEQLGE